eukprot:117947_1
MANETSFHLVFLHGLPGVGKLTTGKILTTKYLQTYKLLHNHMIMEPLKSFFQFASPPFVKLRESHWLQLLQESFKYKLEKKSQYINDFNSKIDGIIFTFPFEYSISKEFLLNVMDLVHKYQNVKVTFIELVCNEQTLSKRITNKDRQKNGKLTDANILKQYIENGKLYSGKTYIENTLNQPNIQINTDGKSVDEIAKLVDDKIQQSIKTKTTTSKSLLKMTKKQLLIAGFYHICSRYIGYIPNIISVLILRFCGTLFNILEIGDELDYKPKHDTCLWKVVTIKDKDVLMLKNWNVILVEYHDLFTTLTRSYWIVIQGNNVICHCVEKCNDVNHVIAEPYTQSLILPTIDEVD